MVLIRTTKSTFYLAVLLLSGCVISSDVVKVRYEDGTLFSSETFVRNLKQTVPQDVSFYVAQISETAMTRLQAQQPQLSTHFREQFFAPWHDDFEEGKDVIQRNRKYFSADFYGENLRLISQKDRQWVFRNADLSTVVHGYAVVVHSTLGKRLPTHSQAFENLRRPGGSYPFDETIVSRFSVGTPVRVMALSYDKRWAFVSKLKCAAWVPIEDIAFVSPEVQRDYESVGLAVCVQENTVIENDRGFKAPAGIGTVLPLKKGILLCPMRDKAGNARLIPCSKNGFAAFPWTFTRAHVQKVAEQLLGQKYGWGGLFESRDCSMLTQDFFAVFGIFLPRNSGDQFDSSDALILSAEQRDRELLEKGLPWLTLVGLPGHVMIYVGLYKEQPVYFHNLFGFKKKHNPQSRFVVGETLFSVLDRAYTLYRSANRVRVLSSVTSEQDVADD